MLFNGAFNYILYVIRIFTLTLIQLVDLKFVKSINIDFSN